MRIIGEGDHTIVEADECAFYFEITGEDRSTLKDKVEQKKPDLDWELAPISVGAYNVLRFGDDNNLPRLLRDTIRQNHLAPRITTKRLFLTWGRGPVLYKVKTEGEFSKRELVNHKHIENWLKSWPYLHYLRAGIVDYNYCEGRFSKVIHAKSNRIGRPFINRLEHVSMRDARLAYLKNAKDNTATHVGTGDWNGWSNNQVKFYHLLNNLTDHPVGITYDYLYGFGSTHYSFPDIYSVLPWIRRSSSIPYIFEMLTKNNLTIRWHIKIPKAYWDNKRRVLTDQCTIQGITFREKMLSDLKKDTYRRIASVLSGEKNTGKFLTSEVMYEMVGDNKIAEMAWSVEPIDQKINDFVKSFIEIAKISNEATTAGMGVHQSLSNVASSGKSDSGSEQLYAYLGYNLTEVSIPEEICTQTINRAIEINFPGEEIKLGFYREHAKRQEDTTPKDRVNAGNVVQ